MRHKLKQSSVKIFASLLSLFVMGLTPSYGTTRAEILFVSLGMPDNTLRAYLAQAAKLHMPVVIRGLYSRQTQAATGREKEKLGSFRDTAERVFSLLKPKAQQSKQPKNSQPAGGVSIDPQLFKRFSISVVPAFVMVSQHSACLTKSHYLRCDEKAYDVVYGNVPIETALKIITDHSGSTQRVERARLLLDSVAASTDLNGGEHA